MFFSLSKIVTFLIDPLFIILVICFFVIFKVKRQRLFALCVFVVLYLISTPFISHKLLYTLEHLKGPSQLKTKYDAIVVLSGMVNLDTSSENKIEFSGAVDRILNGIDLIKKEKADYLILSGGDGGLFSKGRSEARLLEQFALGLDVDHNKIIVDADSRNTYENAVESEALIKKHQFNNILLLTSAFHMFRSQGCFRKVGLTVDIYPVDYEATNQIADFRSFLPSSDALSRTNKFIHELVGIVAYGISGKASYF